MLEDLKRSTTPHWHQHKPIHRWPESTEANPRRSQERWSPPLLWVNTYPSIIHPSIHPEWAWIILVDSTHFLQYLIQFIVVLLLASSRAQEGGEVAEEAEVAPELTGSAEEEVQPRFLSSLFGNLAQKHLKWNGQYFVAPLTPLVNYPPPYEGSLISFNPFQFDLIWFDRWRWIGSSRWLRWGSQNSASEIQVLDMGLLMPMKRTVRHLLVMAGSSCSIPIRNFPKKRMITPAMVKAVKVNWNVHESHQSVSTHKNKNQANQIIKQIRMKRTFS